MALRPVGTLGTIDTITVGGRVFTDVPTQGVAGNLIQLFGSCSSGGQRASMRRLGATAGAAYPVTSGKTMNVFAWFAINRSSGNPDIIAGEVANDVGFASGTAFTSPVYFGTGSSTTSGASLGLLPGGGGSSLALNINGKVSATKFLGVDDNAVGSQQYGYGYEA